MPKILTARRMAMHMSQADLASRLGVSVSTVRRWESAEDLDKIVDLAVRALETEFNAQPHAYQINRGQAAAGRPATSARTLAKHAGSERQHYYLPDSATELSPEQRRALPEGTLVWIYGDVDTGWYPARMRGIFGRPLDALSIPHNQREAHPQPPDWLQPIIDTCPLTRATREAVAKLTAAGALTAPRDDTQSGQFIHKGIVPQAVLDEMAEVRAVLAQRRQEED